VRELETFLLNFIHQIMEAVDWESKMEETNEEEVKKIPTTKSRKATASAKKA
jgi:hypothetical protein